MRRDALLGGVLLLAGVAAAQDPTAYFHYRRAVTAPHAGQVCATVDTAVYAHAASSLKDLRLLGLGATGLYEVPYVLALSEAQPVLSETARVLNLGRQGSRFVFDLEMPRRVYSDVVLELGGADFVGTAEVSGRARDGATPVTLGRFTVFDLTAQRLARSTTLHLAESSFPLLHVELHVRSAAEGGAWPKVVVKGAAVPPSREAQTLFTVAESTGVVEQRARESVARFALPARVPIERVRVVLASGFHGNFSRDVAVRARTAGAAAGEVEQVSGRVERVQMTRDGVDIESTELSLPATLGANLQMAAQVEVAVLNGDDAPLPIEAIWLEMRKRSLCFDSRDDAGVSLFYGDASLEAPVYDYARTFAPATSMVTVALGEEERNPGWRERPDARTFPERHPRLLDITLLGAVCALALVAFRSGKISHRRP